MADGRLKVRLAVPAEAGRANRALVALLAESLGVRAGAVVLRSGHGGRDKIVDVAAPAARVRALGMERAGR
jgi:uncharacterized protein YggU (UPF0235/DUF167 family)